MVEVTEGSELQPYDPGVEIWEKQPFETDRSWAAFQAYRDLLPSERTYVKAYEITTGSRFNGSQVSDNWRKWIRENRWLDRVQAYDQYMDRKMRQQLEERRLRARLETADLGNELKQKALAAIRAVKAITTQVVEKDGRKVRVPKSALSAREIATLADIGWKLERDALGLAEGQGGININLGVGVSVQQTGDEEIIKRATEVIRSRTPSSDGSDRLGPSVLDGDELLRPRSKRSGDGRAASGGTDNSGRSPEAHTAGGPNKG